MTGVGVRAEEKAKIGFLHSRLLICGSELKVDRKAEERKGKGLG